MLKGTFVCEKDRLPMRGGEKARISTLQRTLQHTTTHCNTLQHTATYCNVANEKESIRTLQHTATHCITQ